MRSSYTLEILKMWDHRNIAPSVFFPVKKKMHPKKKKRKNARQKNSGREKIWKSFRKWKSKNKKMPVKKKWAWKNWKIGQKVGVKLFFCPWKNRKNGKKWLSRALFFSREKKKHCVAVSTYLWEKKSQISFEEKMYAWVWGYQIYTQLPTTFLRSAFFTLIWKGREICDKSLTYWRETYCLFHRFLQHSESSPSKIFKQPLLKMSCNAISPPPLFYHQKLLQVRGGGWGEGGGLSLNSQDIGVFNHVVSKKTIFWGSEALLLIVGSKVRGPTPQS